MELLAVASLAIFAGIISQILAYKLRLPAIVPLLMVGSVLGQLGILKPEQLGEGLHTIVQIGVAIILFEGGLSLKVKHFQEAPRVIRNLITIGVFVTWILGTAAAYYFIPNLHNSSGFKIALLFGALITVSGPTVIIPLLKVVKAKRKVSTVLKWEAILIDPIGALLAVVVLTFLITSASGDLLLKNFLSSLSIGLVFGGAGAFLLYRILKARDLIPEELRNLVVLSMVLVIFAISNWQQSETGILAVTVAGFLLGILNPRGLKEIEAFKGQLTTLMVSILFILLAARLDLQAIWHLGVPGLIVLLIVLFVIRPINVFLSSYKSQLILRDKLFLAWVAPRGIVAAAVASLFAETLKDSPNFAQQAEFIESLTFLIVAGTVFFQGATARYVGKMLKVVEPDPNGVIFIGANLAARHLAKALMAVGIDVVLIDSNSDLISLAKKENIPAETGNAISPDTIEEFETASYGKLLAFTPNEKVNVLACQLWAHEFGRNNVFRVDVHEGEYAPSEEFSLSGEGRTVFPINITYEWLQNYLGSSWVIDKQEIKSATELQLLQQRVKAKEIYPLALIKNKKLTFCEPRMEITEGEMVLYLSKASSKTKLKTEGKSKNED
ncbi:MAG TPA: cation:proton antiporter [bacterium]